MANMITNPGGPIKVTLGGTVTSKALADVGGVICMYAESGVSGEVITAWTSGEVQYTSDTGAAWSAGDKIYFHVSNNHLTATSTGAIYAGVASRAKASAAAVGYIQLNVAEQA